ncbi:MAG: HPr kinase/phosphorylase [Proteobacteria bacterium]|jgi:HPr kinase/phosphorylase|nr:HPr kinase/phosphorylase [Pseudomonadota bacterium]
MLQTSVARLYERNRERLRLAWLDEPVGGGAPLKRDAPEAAALVGHLNLIHPNRIQVVGRFEEAHFVALPRPERVALVEKLFAAAPAAIVIAEGLVAPPELLASTAGRGIAMFATPEPAATVIDVLRRHLAKVLAESTERHGVFMDVLGVGVLITGESGAGKSELGLELISRGHGLVADDVVEIARLGPGTLEGRCPPMLKDFLEVRGLGFLNIRTIFGETAIRPKMNLRLIVNLDKPSKTAATPAERLPLTALAEDILGVTVSKVVIPVAAGRNLAVLVEAAVRNYILKLRGTDSTSDFLARQQAALDADVNDDAPAPVKVPRA